MRGKRPCDVELLPVFRQRVKIVEFEDWKPVKGPERDAPTLREGEDG